jgi:hypothetical protein
MFLEQLITCRGDNQKYMQRKKTLTKEFVRTGRQEITLYLSQHDSRVNNSKESKSSAENIGESFILPDGCCLL